MFQHVSVSFIFAIALPYVFSSMVNAALGVIINWLGLWELQNLKHWSLAEVLLQLGWVVPNYFSCSHSSDAL
jgi:hypothetical protein